MPEDSRRALARPRHRRRSSAAIFVGLVAALLLDACDHRPSAPSPAPDPAAQVIPIESSGPIRIAFLNATIMPGSTVSGCGARIEGCTGRLRMTFILNPPSDGPVLYARVYLHATNLLACLWGEVEPFTVRAGVPLTLEMPFDRADSCRTPTDIATMALVVEGPIQVSSRQTWSVRYVFAP